MSIAWQRDENENNNNDDETQHFSLDFQVNQKIKAAVAGGGLQPKKTYSQTLKNPQCGKMIENGISTLMSLVQNSKAITLTQRLQKIGIIMC
jgi:hypothetical protein